MGSKLIDKNNLVKPYSTRKTSTQPIQRDQRFEKRSSERSKIREEELTIDGLFHKWLPEYFTINLNKVFFLDEVIKVLVGFCSIDTSISRNRDTIHL